MQREIERRWKLNEEIERKIREIYGGGIVSFEDDLYLTNIHLIGLLKPKFRSFAIRIRRNSNGTFLQLKAKGEEFFEVSAKIDEEEAPKIIELFKSIGFTEVCRIRKKRETIIRNKVKITIDDVIGLGKFIEIEANSVEKIMEIAKKLGINYAPVKSYLTMLVKGTEFENYFRE